MTNQEIFDKVKKHLLKQGVKSVDAEGFCNYRGLDSTKCAIGALIPDELYKSEMEGWDVYRLKDKFPEVASFLGLTTDKDRDLFRLLADLQGVHDVYDPEAWEEELQDIATRHELKY